MEHDPGGLFDQIGDDGCPAQRCAVVPHDKTLLAAGAVAVFAASVVEKFYGRLELGEVVIDADPVRGGWTSRSVKRSMSDTPTAASSPGVGPGRTASAHRHRTPGPLLLAGIVPVNPDLAVCRRRNGGRGDFALATQTQDLIMSGLRR